MKLKMSMRDMCLCYRLSAQVPAQSRAPSFRGALDQKALIFFITVADLQSKHCQSKIEPPNEDGFSGPRCGDLCSQKTDSRPILVHSMQVPQVGNLYFNTPCSF
jgi:hypothetical protein